MQEGQYMNQQQRAVVQQALEAMTYFADEGGDMTIALGKMDAVITALRQLLEQPEPVQEHVAFLHWYDNAHWGNEDFKEGCHRSWNAAIKYTTPPAQPADHGDELTIAYMDGVHTGKQMAKREWVGLDAEDLAPLRDPGFIEGAKWADAKLREKNGGNL
jgi:hypothetical protein